MKLPTLRISAFQFIYVVIAIATALHTAWGAARTMQGVMPEDTAGQLIWWVQGMFFAIAIDWAMFVIAMRIREGHWNVKTLTLMIISFILAATFSSFFQLLYAWVHSAPIVNSGGVVSEWQTRLGGVINSAPIIVPLMLPGISIVYTLSGITTHKRANTPEKTSVVVSEKPFITTDVQLTDSAQEVKALPAKSSVKALKSGKSNSAKKNVICPGCKRAYAPGSIWRHKQTCSAYIALQVMNSEVMQ